MSKYNIIFMRDDRPVRRLRFKPFWLKAFVYLQVILLAIAALGGYAGYNFWQENKALKKSNAELNTELQRNQVELKRLQNMKKTLESYEQEDPKSLLASLESDINADHSMSVNLKDLFKYVDMGRIGVDNMQSRFVGERLELQFEINNLVGDTALSGMIRSSLITNQGNVIELDLEDSDLDFKIQNFKRIKTSLPISGELGKEDIFGIRIIIKNDQDTTIFRETYPLSHIMS